MSARRPPARKLRVEGLEDRLAPAILLEARQSAAAAVAHLRTEMDRTHTAVGVYADVDHPGNHFFARAKFPAADSPATMNEQWVDRPRSGATAIRAEFTPTGPGSFAGFFFLNGVLTGSEADPRANFGTVPDAGVNLTGATSLSFWARGEKGGERVAFFMGGVGRDPATGAPEPGATHPDSAVRTPALGVTFLLTPQWRRYTVSLGGRDLRSVLGGFGWGAGYRENPTGAVFYLDDIQYNLRPATKLRRLGEPRFIGSFRTLPVQPSVTDPDTADDLDRVLRNTAYAYDNAHAVLAFLAVRTRDGLRRAKLIGEAFLYALEHDRRFDDGRVRTAYRAGDLRLPPGWTPNGRAGTTAVPGFSADDTRFVEVEQGSTDTGNNAWVGIALLALHKRTGDPRYLAAAVRVGAFLLQFRNNSGTYHGFLGGVENPEGSAPAPRRYASTEHNIDLRALFATLFGRTGDPRWQAAAAHAEAFAEAMWDEPLGAYLTGTHDPDTRNTDVLPVDVAAWSTLAIPGVLGAHPAVLDNAVRRHLTLADGVVGFDFDTDRDGVWFEGTGQMAVALAAAGRATDAGAIRRELRRAQRAAPFGDRRGLAAASHDGVTTGFNSRYFRRLHVGATAWLAHAQLAVNPFDLP